MSSFAQGYSQTEAQLLITLCGLSYLDSDPLPDESAEAQTARMKADIDAALATSAYPTWRVVWGPGLSGDRANMLYAAGDSTTSQVAVVVRGTDWSFWLNWIENFASVLPLVPFTSIVPGLAEGTPQIAAGTNLGLSLLLSARGRTSTGDESDLTTFLGSRPAGTDVYFTGHSLGGCLTSVLGPSIVYQLGSTTNVKLYTFAAPSAGNADFASYFDRLFTDSGTGESTAFRVYNNLDIVPTSWASLDDIVGLYVPAPPCTSQMKALVDWAQQRVAGDYMQVGAPTNGSAVLLRGQVVTATQPPPTAQSGDNVAFFGEVDYQHTTETYMQLLGAPVSTTWVSKLWGTLAAVGVASTRPPARASARKGRKRKAG